jgi:hypothetical protein
MVSFRTKDPNLGLFRGTLEWKMLLYILVIWTILLPLGVMYGTLVTYFLSFGIFSPALVYCTKKNLATL